MSLEQRLLEVRQRIDSAARLSGRSADQVRLIAVSKKQPTALIAEAHALGVQDFGENYVQELVGKRAELSALTSVRFHMIGHLQHNKVRSVVGSCYGIQSFDSERSLLEAEKRAALANLQLEAFVQVNVASEPQKDGCEPGDLQRLVDVALGCVRLKLVGLMTIPPATEAPAAARPYFRKLKALQEQLNTQLPRLSMGMSSDYEVAIEEGATDVRVGTALFGARMTPNSVG